LLLIGIPGSGKSTWLKQLPGNFEIICPDQIRKRLSGGDISDQTLNVQVWEEAKKRTVEALQAGQDVVLDATNVNTTRRREFLAGLPECLKKAKIFDISPEEACQRIKADLEIWKDRAAVPDEIVYRMYGEFLYTEKVLESEGFFFL
jgi:predicted kinase